MSTSIYRLVTELAADPSPMDAGFARGLASAKRFAESIAPTIAGIGNKTGVSEGDRIARNILGTLQSTLAKDQGTIGEAFARGSLSPSQFEKLGKQAGDSFNTGILNTISTLGNKGLLSAKARQNLQNALIQPTLTTQQQAAAAGPPPPPLVPPHDAEQASSSISKIGSELRALGKDLTQIGFEASILFTVPLVEGARKGVAAAEELAHAVEHIGVSTGATGLQLESLRGSFDRLFLNLPNSAADVSTAISRIAQTSGAAGPQLDAIATQVLNLSRITGTDLPNNVDTTQRAFKAWGVALGEQTRDLDTLFKVSQATGAGVSTIAESLAHFAPALRQFGLSFSQSASLIGQFEKNGIDADAVLTTLQTSLSRFAEKGVDGAHALQLFVSDVKRAGTDAEAVNLASRIFGPRQAAQLADAIRQGSLDFQKLADQVASSGNTINKTAATTDVFGQRLRQLTHEATLSGSAVGETLERAFISLEPALVTVVGGLGDVARAFGSLPAPVTTTVVGILATAAAIGPLTLALGGITRAAGATALALGILQKAEVSASAADLTRSMIQGSTVLGTAATNATLLARGLGLVKGGLIGLTITTFVGAIGAMTRESREAKEKLDEFRASLVGLGREQLIVKTTELQHELDARLAQVNAIEARIRDLRVQGDTPFSGIDHNAASDSIAALRTQQGDIIHGNRAVADSLFATGQAFGKVSGATDDAAAAAAKFQDEIAKVIETTGKGITVDEHGTVSGSLTHLRELAKTLNDELTSRKEIKGFDPTLATQALNHVETAITDAQNRLNGIHIASIFDQLSPDLVLAQKQIAGLVATAENARSPLEALGNIRLTDSILKDLDDVNARLAKQKDLGSEDAKALIAMQKSLQGTLAGAVARNPTGAGAFSIGFTAKLDRIDVPPDAGDKLLAVIRQFRVPLDQAAEEAAAAELNLTRAKATGSLLDIELAGTAAAVANQKAKNVQDDFTHSILATGASATQTKAAIAALKDEATRLGANQANIELGIQLDPDMLQLLQADVKDLLGKLPRPELGLKLFAESLSLTNIELDVSTALQKAAIKGLAGDQVGASITRNTALDGLARQFHDLANTMDLENPSAADRAEFALIQAAAARLGVSLDDLSARFKGLSASGKIVRFADAFTEATAAAFGTSSAIAKITQGLDQAIKSGLNLSDAIGSLLEGGGFSSFLDALSSLGGIVGALGSLGVSFGKSKLDIEHDQILATNNQALKDLTASLDRQAGTGGRTSDLIKAITEAQGASSQFTSGAHVTDDVFLKAGQAFIDAANKAGSLAQPNDINTAGIEGVLDKFHLTLDQAAAAAKALGVTLLDSKGNVVGLDAFMKALAQQATILTTLGTDLSAAQKRISVDNAIAGGATRTPAQVLKDQIDAVAQVLDAQGGTLGKSLEQAFADGPAAIRAKLSELAQLIEDGKISLADLGNFASASDFFDAIGTTADDLNALGTAASSVADTLTNVPTGFKKALDEFNASLPQNAPGTTRLPTLPMPQPTDTTPVRGPDVGGSLLDRVKEVFAKFTTPVSDLSKSSNAIAGSVAASTGALGAFDDSLARLTVSATDVADALDQMFGTTSRAGTPGTSSNGITAQARFPAPPTRTTATGDLHFHGPVTVNVDAKNKSVAEIAPAVAAAFRVKARQLTGDSMRVVDALQRM